MAVGRTQAELAASGARRGPGPSAAANARVLALLARHEASLMRVARQWSLCQDDAFDAFQRGLEIYVRRLDTVDEATEAAWLKVVIRHEALAIRRSRADCAVPDVDLDATVATADRSVEEQVLSGDRVSRSAEALRALKPDEARALMLKAHGLSYDEIGRRCGWTYTKVNRAITEGRRRFMEVYAALESGSECERFAPVLQALAEGTATSAQLVEVRPHLRRCSACRATVRDLHLSGLRRIRLVAPSLLTLHWLRERLGGGGPPRTDGAHLSPLHHVVPRLGHVVIPRASGGAAERMGAAVQRTKQHVTSLVQRLNASDLAAAIHVATTTGGGRVATLGAIVGMCLSGVGAGTVCVVTGVIRAPFGWFEAHHAAPRSPRPTPHRHAAPASRAQAPPADRRPIRVVAVAPTPTPAPRPRPHQAAAPTPRPAHARTTPPPPPSADPSQGTTPTSQQYAPVSPAPAQPAAQEFSPAPASGTGASAAPAAAPATGGEEFGP